MIGKCFYSTYYYSLIIGATEHPNLFKCLVVFVDPQECRPYRTANSRIFKASSWSVERMLEVPKEDFLRVYQEAMEEFISLAEEAL